MSNNHQVCIQPFAYNMLKYRWLDEKQNKWEISNYFWISIIEAFKAIQQFFTLLQSEWISIEILVVH